ncbi:DNA-binding response regulator, partial [Streptomyces sp. NPDC001940]
MTVSSKDSPASTVPPGSSRVPRRATRTRPDAALLDVMLPDGDGRALGRELRARR